MIISRLHHPGLIVTLLAFAAGIVWLAGCSTVETQSFVVRDAANKERIKLEDTPDPVLEAPVALEEAALEAARAGATKS